MNEFARMFEEARKTQTYHLEGALIEFTESMLEHMEHAEMSQEELARQIGRKQVYLTRILRGTSIPDLDTMVRIARVLNCTLQCRLVPDPEATPKEKS